MADVDTVIIGNAGERVYFRIDIDTDLDSSLRDLIDELETVEERAAWEDTYRQGLWRYVSVTVTPVVDGFDLDGCGEALYGCAYGAFPSGVETGTHELAHVYPGPDLVAEVQRNLRKLVKSLTAALNPIMEV